MPERSKRRTNGWRDGYDPVQRWLRIITVVVLLAVFVSVAATRERGPEGLVVISLALGAVLILLGYEGIVQLPIIGTDDEHQHSRRPRNDDEENHE